VPSSLSAHATASASDIAQPSVVDGITRNASDGYPSAEAEVDAVVKERVVSVTSEPAQTPTKTPIEDDVDLLTRKAMAIITDKTTLSPESQVRDALDKQVQQAHAASDAVSRRARADQARSTEETPGSDTEPVSLIEEFEVSNLLLRQALETSGFQLQSLQRQLSAVQDRRQEEKKHHLSVADNLKKDRDQKLAQLNHSLTIGTTRLETLENEHGLMQKNTDKTIASLNMDIEKLKRELEHERDPKRQWLQRLTVSKELKIDQEERDRQQSERQKRLDQRADYDSFQDFFLSGTLDLPRWLHGDLQAQARLHVKTKRYWQSASVDFDAFAHRIKEGYGHPNRNSKSANRPSVKQRKHSNHVLEQISQYLRKEADDANRTLKDFDDHLWTFAKVTWDALKTRSHDVRYYTRILRFSSDVPIGQLGRRIFTAAREERMTDSLRQVRIEMGRELSVVKRELERERDPERSQYWRRRKNAIHAGKDAISIGAEVLLKDYDLVEADWVHRQPLTTLAIMNRVEPLLDNFSDLRYLVESGMRDFVSLGLSNKLNFLKSANLVATRKQINALEKIVYRNCLLAEKHGNLDDPQLANLRTLPLRRYKRSASNLVALLNATPHGVRIFSAISSWAAHGIDRKRSTGRSVGYSTDKIEHSPVSRRLDLVKEEPTTRELADDSDTSALPDSPMDAFEMPRLDNLEAATSTYVPIATNHESATERSDPSPDQAQVDNDRVPSEIAEVSTKPGPVSTKPIYISSKRANQASRPSSNILPRTGILPKPEYRVEGGRGRRRPLFKPTKARRDVFRKESMDVLDNEQGSQEAGFAAGDADVESPNFATTDADTKTSDPIITTDADPKSATPEQTEEVHVPLTYQIPRSDLHNALVASKSSGAAFWKHSLYKGPRGEKIPIHYCVNYEQAEKQAKLFLNESVLGFDAEWEPNRQGFSSIKEHMSLIQIASESRVALFHIASFHGDTPEVLMPPTLRFILESPTIIKAGVHIAGDYTRLKRCFAIQGQGLFELSHLYKIVKYAETDPSKIDRKSARMADQVEEFLFLPMAKGLVRTSSWSKKLTQEQAEYAASDAYAGFRLFDALEARRKAMNPAPPRPAFYELQAPLLLGNGKPPPRKIKPRVKTKAASESNNVGGETTSAKEEAAAVEENADAVAVADDEMAVEGEDFEEAVESEDEYHSCKSEFDETSDDGPNDKNKP